MKQNLFKRIHHFMTCVFNPHSGLVPATLDLQRAMREARQKHSQTGHRYYAIWDAVDHHLVTLSYDGYHGRVDSYQHMRHRGAFPPVTRKEFKADSFFYTASQNGGQEMPQHRIQQKLEILRKRYYAS